MVTVRCSPDLHDLVHTSTARLESRRDDVGLLHVGSTQPSVCEVSTLVHRLAPGFYLTGPARHALAHRFRISTAYVTSLPCEVAGELPIYRGQGLWPWAELEPREAHAPCTDGVSREDHPSLQMLACDLPYPPILMSDGTDGEIAPPDGSRLDVDDVEHRVRSYLPLVHAVARRHEGRGLAFVHLVQQGRAGLVQAARRFDPDEGVAFVPYATWWIRRSVLDALKSSRHRVPGPVPLHGRHALDSDPPRESTSRPCAPRIPRPPRGDDR
jgi:hypothetical protein